MHRRGWALTVVAIACVAVMALAACAPKTPTAVEPVKQQIDQQTQQKQASVDEILSSAQATVTALASAVGGLEARVNGLQVNSDLQGIQRQLTDALAQSGAKKKDALDQLSQAFTALIEKVDTAAAKLPAGGTVNTELTDFAMKLKGVQASLAEAAASYGRSSTP
jgi:DNA repair exonuclease SbcCD ATPase subunit